MGSEGVSDILDSGDSGSIFSQRSDQTEGDERSDVFFLGDSFGEIGDGVIFRVVLFDPGFPLSFVFGDGIG